MALPVDGLLFPGNGGDWFDRYSDDDGISTGNSSQNTAGVVVAETFRGDGVVVLPTGKGGGGKTLADFHTLNRSDGHHGPGQFAVELVENRLA